MSMNYTQDQVMNSLRKADRMESSRINTLPKTYAALLDEHGEEVEITDAQICHALEAVEDMQLFPFGTQQTTCGRWVASKAPSRKLHS